MFASHSSSGGTSASCSNCAGVRLCFLSGTRSIVHSFFKHDNAFYHVREGDLFEALSRSYKQGIAMAAAVVRAPQESERACVVHGDLVYAASGRDDPRIDPD